MSEPSNIRWEKVSPRTWMTRIQNPSSVITDVVVLTLDRPKCWALSINHVHIASFNTWEEAEGAVPMLYKLHKDSK